MTTNISTLCYDFIEQNIHLFDLSQYDVDHSMNFELLDYYVSKQTCSEKYFELLRYVYRQSTYIDCRTFIQQYTNNINELNERFNNRELIVLFPYLEINKSNFFLSLYFLYLYNSILSKKINYVFSYIKRNKKTNIIDISTLSLTREPLIIVCDDFLYSGGQLALSVAHFPLICSNTLNVYACIVGMTSASIEKFSKQKLQDLGKDDYAEEEPLTPVINCSYDVIFPQHNLVIDRNLKIVIRDKMFADGFYNDTISETTQIYDYILLNDMYILEIMNNKLYAVGQFSQLYYNLKNTLIYLFFKYPDLISTVLTMCILYQYSKKYTVSLDKLFSPITIKKYPTDGRSLVNKFEITQELFNSTQDLEEIKKNIKTSTPINLDKFDWLQKCSDYDFTLDTSINFVSADYYNRIELIRNLKKKFSSVAGGVCNDSIITFYKQKSLISIFTVFSNLIKSSIISGGKSNTYIKNKKSNKKIKKSKLNKSVKKSKKNQKKNKNKKSVKNL